VKGAILYDMQLQTNPNAATFILRNSKDIDVQRVRGVKDANIRMADNKSL
jgi:hypothetical protein